MVTVVVDVLFMLDVFNVLVTITMSWVVIMMLVMVIMVMRVGTTMMRSIAFVMVVT